MRSIITMPHPDKIRCECNKYEHKTFNNPAEILDKLVADKDYDDVVIESNIFKMRQAFETAWNAGYKACKDIVKSNLGVTL